MNADEFSKFAGPMDPRSFPVELALREFELSHGFRRSVIERRVGCWTEAPHLSGSL